VLLAILAIFLVAIQSIPPPITPPKKGTTIVKFTISFNKMKLKYTSLHYTIIFQ